MKRYWYITLVVLSYLVLTGCASSRNPYPKGNFIEERWMSQVDKDPDQWTAGADSWFLTGDPNIAEQLNNNAPYSFSITTMMVKVDDFNKIKVIGDFQTQIFGAYGQNTAFVYGPNDAVRNIKVEVRGDTLWVRQIGPSPFMKQVIVRVGVNQLTSLMQLGGCGSIEGVRMNSRALEIIAQPQATGEFVEYDECDKSKFPFRDFYRMVMCLDYSYEKDCDDVRLQGKKFNLFKYEHALLKRFGESGILVRIAVNALNERKLCVRFNPNSRLASFLRVSLVDEESFGFTSLFYQDTNLRYPCVFFPFDKLELFQAKVDEHARPNEIRKEILTDLNAQINNLNKHRFFMRIGLGTKKVAALITLRDKIAAVESCGDPNAFFSKIIEDWEQETNRKSQQQLTNAEILAKHRNVFHKKNREDVSTKSQEVVLTIKTRLQL